ncbi:MAG: hypothetical protein JW760_05750 [Spirochaetales bacterium]|nr:hypothetical protein [Spirochaetales bacterium]
MEMSVALGREIFFIELWHLLALVVILCMNTWFYQNGEKNGLLYRFFALQASLLIWVVSKMLKTVSPDAGLRWFFIVTQYFGNCLLGPFFFLFAYRYLFGRDAPRRYSIVLYIPAAFFFLAVATNPQHYRFYATYTFYRDTFGPLFYGFSVYTYTLILAGILLFLYDLLVFSRGRGNGWIILAAVLPLLVNAAYTYTLFGFKPMFDYTPLFMTLSLAFFGAAAFRSRFLGVLPAAWKALLLELEDPLILADRRGKIVRLTKLAPGTLPREEIRQSGRVYRLHRRREGKKGTLYHYVDVTDITELQEALGDRNRRLEESIEEIRNRNRITLRMMKDELLSRFRRELHDILGHSLTQAIYLLRLEEKHPSKEGLDRVKQTIDRGLELLESSLHGRIGEGNSLSIALGKVMEECRFPDIAIDFLLRGIERPLSPPLVKELASCCREGITNAVKHGHPGRISLVLLFGKETVALILSDDGSGCKDPGSGQGLAMMRRGLSRYEGTLAVRSEPGEGFQLTLRVPCGHGLPVTKE